MRVLIIEDEPRLARNIAKAITETTSYAVDISSNGEDGQHQALSNPYDLIVLDLMLPKVPGLDILARLRREGNRVPVLLTPHPRRTLRRTLSGAWTRAAMTT